MTPVPWQARQSEFSWDQTPWAPARSASPSRTRAPRIIMGYSL